jgi:hypothetical protein
MTRAGVIMGTAAYMSLELARGKNVDARTDIWAFGCVVYEMLTGRSPFDGETISDVLGAIVHKEPAWSTLPPATPERVRRMLQRCLTKDPKQRLHNIADARLEIKDVIAARRSGVAKTVPVGDARATAARPREIAAWAIAAAAVIALVAGAWLVTSGTWSGRGSAEPSSLRVSILPVEGGEVGAAVISPDGRKVAYSARRADGTPLIWIRDLSQSQPRPLAGTEGGNRPFWSPDSTQLGFAVGGVLERMSADGGPIHEITRGVRVGASWGPDDVVLYHAGPGEIRKIAAGGGAGASVTRLPGPDWDHLWPRVLPEGRSFLFTAKHWTRLAETGSQGICIGSMDGGEVRQVLPDLSSAVYAIGHVIFRRDGQLMAAPFDVEARRVTGEPIALGEPVAGDINW